MKQIIDFSVLIIKFLIGIGDGVLFIVQLIANTIDSFLSILSLMPKGIYSLLKAIFSPPLRFLKNRKGAKPKLLYKRPVVMAVKVKKEKPRVKRVIIYATRPLTKVKFFTIGVIFSCIFIFIPAIVLIFLQDLPSPNILSEGQIAQTTKIYDRNGILLYQIFANQNRSIIPLSQIPNTVKQATVAIEDKDFYTHPGFDLQAIIRSLIEDIKGKDIQGGSTITQQLIKSALLNPERSVIRKIKEVSLAFWTERIYTKDQILELYLNQIPYGGTSYGVEAAAGNYFGMQAKDLDLAESAFVAGLARAPSLYSPFNPQNSMLWKKRQTDVLNRMVDLHYITKDQAEIALDEDLIFKPPQVPIHAPHFVQFVKDLLIQKYGLPIVEKGGLTVMTSIDLKLQDQVEKVVADEVAKDANLNISNGAVLMTNPQNGDILAMVGSHDYYDPNGGTVNLTTSLRQPGSSIKVVTYSAALSKGFTAASILDDSPIVFPGNPPYAPVNYDGRFHGRIPLRIALANSLNIPAVKTLNQIGIPSMVNLAKAMGVKSWNNTKDFGLGVTLGSNDVTMTDMATVFGTLANGGGRVDLNPIISVTDSKGNVIEKKNPVPLQVLDSGVAFIVSNILQDNDARTMEFGPNSPLNIAGVSVKTGTSDEKRDNWTMGYTRGNVVTVWVGNNDNSPMNQALASGITGAAPIWNKIVKDILNIKANLSGPVPADVVSKLCLGHTEYFIRGTENSVNCTPPPPPSPTPTPGT